jgi:GAF domain-containing protein
LATVVALYVLEVVEVIPVSLAPVASLVDLILLELVFGFAILLLRVVVGRTADALARAKRNQAELSASNRELREIRSSLEQRIIDRTRGLQAATEVSQATISILDVDELLPRVVYLVQERFGLYYVGVFLVDETGEWTQSVEGQAEPGRWVVLRAGTGAAGAQMIADVHRFEVGDPLSMIGRCVNEGDVKVALGVGLVSGRFSNPLLPDTRSELALPLRSRGRVVGALTVQSVEEDAFDEQTIAVMQTIADQVGVTIDNARSFASAQEALARSEAIARRYVQDTWDRLVESSAEISGYRYASDRTGPTGDAWLPVMGKALRQRDVAIERQTTSDGNEEELSLAVPLIFGDTVIGTVGLKRPGAEPWSEEQIALVQDIGVQVAQTIETRRLFEETQRSARREVVLRQTTERVRSQANLDALLKSAVQEIQRAVGATRVAIRLGTEDRVAPAGKGGQDG